ncbi:amino acid adenylation domain-containing protein, partial [Marilutibacter chinensis]
SRAYEAPVGEVEEAIAGIWRDLLGLERVGRNDHFFELGGHSLIAVQLVTRVREALGMELQLRDVFACPVMREMASTIDAASADALPSIVRVDRDGVLPLSYSQQRLWMLDQIDHAAGSAYHMPLALKLVGTLDADALQASLDRIVDRHETLRTHFESVDGAPSQVVGAVGAGFRLTRHDLSLLDPPAQSAAVAEHSVEEAHALFDLSTGPLIRGRLLRLSDREHVLLVTQHHIISDGWSHGVLLREVKALYTAFLGGEADPLPELAIQYADYAAWQRSWLQGKRLEDQVGYWREHLSGAPALLDMPTDRPRPPVQSYNGDRIDIELPAPLTAAVRDLAQRHGTTLFMTLLAAWSTLLSRLSGQDDVVIGTPVANRQHSETEPLIGFFLNTLALRVRTEGDPTVAELLAQVKRTTLEGYAHQDLPFEQVVEAVQPVRSLSHNLMFQAMLTLDNTPRGGTLSLPGVEMSQMELLYYKAHFDLGLFFADEGQDVLSGELEFATDLFDRGTIERLRDQFILVLEAMAADDRRRLSTLPLTSASERTRLLEVLGRGGDSAVEPVPAHRWFERHAAHAPEAPALFHEGTMLDYREVNRRANRVAHRLVAVGAAAGTGPGGRVALRVSRGPEMVVGLLAVLKAGCAYVPIDPALPLERQRYMLEDARPSALIADVGSQQDILADLRADVPVVALDDATLQEESDADPFVDGFDMALPAYVIYTSGSTGNPKGVVVAHAQLAAYLSYANRAYAVRETAGAVVATPLAFDATVTSLLVPWLSGKPVALLPEEPQACLLQVLAYARRPEPWLFKLTPAHLEAMSNLAEDAPVGTAHVVVVGGEQLTTRGLRRFRDRVLPAARVVNEYGPTETVVGCTTFTSDGREVLEGDAVPIGRPIDGVRIRLLDTHGEPVPVGARGEIHIAGAQVATGYLDRAALTAERFLPDPFSAESGARMYRTGDIARWLPDGQLEYLGRNDFQVKIRGYRIELGEIEAALVAAAGVREAVVLVRASESGDKRLLAFVVPDADLAVAELRDGLAAHLAEYMIPSAFICLDALPLTGNGKVDRAALLALDQEVASDETLVAPCGETEETVAEIWRELFELERIGRNDNFFHLGGHSLMAISLMERLRQRGLKADIGMLFTDPTLGGFAAQLVRQDAPEWEVPENLISDAFAGAPEDTEIEEYKL